MNVLFGWGLDFASPVDDAVLGQATVGPDQMARLLAVRTGVADAEEDPVLRTAHWRQAVIATAPEGSWWHRSVQLDAWAVATATLPLRDRLVAAGWDGTADASAPPRLQALSQAMGYAARHGIFIGGPADLIRAVTIRLEELLTTHPNWPIGIDTITVRGQRTLYPDHWQKIFTLLEGFGVTVLEENDPKPITHLSIITASTAWEAAATAARILAGNNSGRPYSVIAGSDTQILDGALARHGLPALGVHTFSTERSTAVAMQLFVSAFTAPLNIEALIDVLLLHISPLSTSTGADDTADVSFFIPRRIANPLLYALSRTPGLSDSWDTAVDDLLTNEEKTFLTDEDRDLVRFINDRVTNGLVETTTDDHGVATIAATDVASLLAKMIEIYKSRHSYAANTAASHVETACAALTTFDRLTATELTELFARTGGTTSAANDAEAGDALLLVRDPAGLGSDSTPVLWWIPTPAGRAPALFRPSESTWLHARGIHPATARDEARLATECRLRALRTHGDITIIRPDILAGTPVEDNPLLSFLANDLNPNEETHAVLAKHTRRADALLKDPDPDFSQCIFDPLIPSSGPVTVQLPTTTAQKRPVPYGAFLPAGVCILPNYLSYSQLHTMLIHPTDWILQYALHVKEGVVRSLTSGNAMIGTLLHGVVEHIVKSGWYTTGVVPTHTQIEQAFLWALPRYAAPLGLPSAARECAEVLDTATKSITTLFTVLRDNNMTATGTESEFHFTIPDSAPLRIVDGFLTDNPAGKKAVRDALGPMADSPVYTSPITVAGSRDMDIEFADGSRGVIDLKYTAARGKYSDLVDHGGHMQLAIYAHSVIDELEKENVHPIPAEKDIPVAYFMLKQGRFDSTFPQFGKPRTITSEFTGGPSLYSRVVTKLMGLLESLATGCLYDPGNRFLAEYPEFINRSVSKLSPKHPFKAAVHEHEQYVWNNDGFIPTESLTYTDYRFITGLAGDYQ